MPRKIISFFANNLSQPFFNLWIIYIIVVNPSFIACIIRGININALNFPLVHRQECFQRVQIITMNNHVAAVILSIGCKCVLPFQCAERHFQMVIDHFFFTDPVQRWHCLSPCSMFGSFILPFERISLFL